MEWITLAIGIVGLATIVIKYVFSGEAAKQAKEEKFQQDEAAKQQAVAQKEQENQAAKPSQSQSWNKIWDAEDQQK